MSEQKPVKFIVLSLGRAGSKMLIERLSTHNDIHIRAEILHSQYNAKHSLPYKILRRIAPDYYRNHYQFNGRNTDYFLQKFVWGKAYQNYKACGFKLIEHQWEVLDPDQKQVILDQPDIKIIYLDRIDVLSHYVSLERGKRFGFTHRREGMPPLDFEPIEIFADKFNVFLKLKKMRNMYFRQMFAQHQWIDVHYEDLVARPDEENARLLDFLNTPQKPLRDLLIPNSDKPLSARIANFKEFSDQLRGTRGEQFLNPEPLLRAKGAH